MNQTISMPELIPNGEKFHLRIQDIDQNKSAIYFNEKFPSLDHNSTQNSFFQDENKKACG